MMDEKHEVGVIGDDDKGKVGVCEDDIFLGLAAVEFFASGGNLLLFSSLILLELMGDDRSNDGFTDTDLDSAGWSAVSDCMFCCVCSEIV